MNCELQRIKKDNKVYFKVILKYGDGKKFDFAIKPMFLSKNAYITLLRLTDKVEKSK